ncbi:MAG: DUF3426 domain-containing protein [Desulfobacterales bacterium]|nr:DUF3426 domain-containing protein [Desulfobacterales bacterium]
MITTCKKCDTSFNLPDRLVKKTGSKVRCSRCQTVYVAYPPEDQPPPEGPPSLPSSGGIEMPPEAELKSEITPPPDLQDPGSFDLEDLKLDLEIPADGTIVPEEPAEFEELGLELVLEPEIPADRTAVPKEPGEPGEPAEPGDPDLNLELDLGGDLQLEALEEEKAAAPDLQEMDSIDLEALNLALQAPEDVAPEEEFPETPMEYLDPDELEGAAFFEAQQAAQVQGPEEESPSEESVAGVMAQGPKAAIYMEALPDRDGAQDAKKTLGDYMAQMGDAAALKKGKPKKPFRRIRTQILVFFMITLAAGGGYALYTLLGPMGPDRLKAAVGGWNIPYVSDYFKPEVPEAGNLKMTTSDIESKFLDSAGGQKIFVISGKVKNEYPEPRSFIRVTGKLFNKGKISTRVATVYGGNILAEEELARLSPEAIRTRLSNRPGDHNANVGVKPNQSVSFMIVFGNLPTDLEEFSIQVEGSSRG